MLRLSIRHLRLLRARHVSPLATEALEPRQLLTTLNGAHDLEFAGRAADGLWWASGYDAGTSGLTDEVFAVWSTAVNWKHIRFGDYDGDGLDDIAGWDPSSGYWWTSLSDGFGDSTTVVSGRWSNATNWSDVGVVDLAASGDRGDLGHFTRKDDLVGRAADGTWWAAVSNGNGAFDNVRLTQWDPAAGWRDIQFIDYDNSGEVDIVGRTSGGQWWAARNTGGLTFQNVFLGTWDESFGWHDVVSVHNFFDDGREAILGRATDGTWNVLRFTDAGAVTGPIAIWNEAVGWRDVTAVDLDDDGATDVLGRTSSGDWWVLPAFEAGMAVPSQLIGHWAPASGWADVSAAVVTVRKQFISGGFYEQQDHKLIGRAPSGAWWVSDWSGVGMMSNALIGHWSVGPWNDVQPARISRQPIAEARWKSTGTGAFFSDVTVNAHRAGTEVIVENATENSVTGIRITYQVPSIGFTLTRFIGREPGAFPTNFRVTFGGHVGADVFRNHSVAESRGFGRAANDVLDGLGNGAFDQLFGGDGLDTLLGDPGDLLRQDM